MVFVREVGGLVGGCEAERLSLFARPGFITIEEREGEEGGEEYTDITNKSGMSFGARDFAGSSEAFPEVE